MQVVANTINPHPITALSNVDSASQSQSSSLRRDRSATKFESQKIYAHVSTHNSAQTSSISPISMKSKPKIPIQQASQQNTKVRKKQKKGKSHQFTDQIKEITGKSLSIASLFIPQDHSKKQLTQIYSNDQMVQNPGNDWSHRQNAQPDPGLKQSKVKSSIIERDLDTERLLGWSDSTSNLFLPMIVGNQKARQRISALDLTGRKVGDFGLDQQIRHPTPKIFESKLDEVEQSAVWTNATNNMNRKKASVIQLKRKKQYTIMPMLNLPERRYNSSQLTQLPEHPTDASARELITPSRTMARDNQSSMPQIYYAGIQKQPFASQRYNHEHLQSSIKSHRKNKMLDSKASATERKNQTLEQSIEGAKLQKLGGSENQSRTEKKEIEGSRLHSPRQSLTQSIRVVRALKEIRRQVETKKEEARKRYGSMDKVQSQNVKPLVAPKHMPQRSVQLIDTDLRESTDLIKHRKKSALGPNSKSVMSIIQKREERSSHESRMIRAQSQAKLTKDSRQSKNLNSDLGHLESEKILCNGQSISTDHDEQPDSKPLNEVNKLVEPSCNKPREFRYVTVIKKRHNNRNHMKINTTNLTMESGDSNQQDRVDPYQIIKLDQSPAKTSPYDQDQTVDTRQEQQPLEYEQIKSKLIEPIGEESAEQRAQVQSNALPQTHRTLKQYPPWMATEMNQKRRRIVNLKHQALLKHNQSERQYVPNLEYSVEKDSQVYDHVLPQHLARPVIRDNEPLSNKRLEQNEVFKRLNRMYWEKTVASAARRHSPLKDVSLKHQGSKARRNQQSGLTRAQRPFEMKERIHQRYNHSEMRNGAPVQSILPRLKDNHGMVISNMQYYLASVQDPDDSSGRVRVFTQYF